MSALFRWFVILISAVALLGCASEENASSGPALYDLKVAVTNAVSGDRLVIAQGSPANGAYSKSQVLFLEDATQVTSSAPATLMSLPAGNAFQVSVIEGPMGRTCLPTPASGTISGPTTVTIDCGGSTSFDLSGSISGLGYNESLSVALNGNVDNVSGADPTFLFSASLRQNTEYRVTVSNEPSGKTCTVNGGNGIAQQNITNVEIYCSSSSYSVSGQILGLNGTLKLANNGGNVQSFPYTPPVSLDNATSDNLTDNLTVASTTTTATDNTTDNSTSDNITFHFDVPLGASYEITVAQQPIAKCYVENGTGNAAATNVLVKCWGLIDGGTADTGLNLLTDGDSSSPQLAADNSSLYAIWKQTSSDGTSSVIARKYDNTSGTWEWSWMDRFSSGGIVSFLSDQVASPSFSNVDSTPYAGWAQYDSAQSAYQVWVAGYANGSWNPFLGRLQDQPSGCTTFCGLNDNLSDNASHVQTLADGSILHVAWQEGTRIVHKSLDTSQSTPSWSVEDNLTGVENPGLVDNGSSIVLTYDNTSDTAHYWTGSGTPLLDNVTSGVSVWHNGALHSLGVSSTDQTLVYGSTASSARSILYKELGQATSSPQLLSDGTNLYAVWLENSGTEQIRVMISPDDGASWSFIDGGGKDGLNVNTARLTSEPHGAVLNGRLYLTWTEENGDGVTQIRVAQAPAP